jgi:hypothetical protein
MVRPNTLKPRRLAPLFTVTALLHGAALATRFTEVAALLPEGVAGAILLAHFPLLLVEGLFEGFLDYGEERSGMPLWMRINSRPVKWSFTLGFTYLGVVVLQAWDISIGPMNPNPPAEWPLAQRGLWFGIMSVGMFFPNYLVTTSFLIPVLRVITRPLRRLPKLVGALLAMVVGGGLGYGASALLGSEELSAELQGLQDSIMQRPLLYLGITLAMVWIPVLIDLVRERSSGDREGQKDEDEDEDED